MNPAVWIQGLQGLTLAAVICGFLFVEEAGVPVPFAPGDLLLAIGGIAIVAGKVNPFEFIVMAVVAIVAGALLGREAFALLGWERLMRVATPLRARMPLQRASELLQQNGWRAVFTARLIPGLRVHTTQVAGVSRMPRLTFLTGLMPATAVYVAAFVGLGAAFGHPILNLIHQAERQVLLLIAVLVLGAILVLWLRAPAARALTSLGGWSGVFKFRLDSAGIIVVPACIGLNFTGHALAVELKLPLFLDTIGTILCAVLAGPWVGGSVGFISNLVSSNTVDPIAAPYSVVSFAVGFAAGVGRYLTKPGERMSWLALWPVCFLIASVASTPINVVLYQGRSGVALGDTIYAYLAGAHIPTVLAAFLGEAAIDIPDKLITVGAALLIYRSLPEPAASSRLEFNIGKAFAFVFRSRGWLSKILIGALCLLLSWLLIPFLLFAGYSVAVARGVRDGSSELPAWDRLGLKLKDGFLLTTLLFIWYLPAVVVALLAEVMSGNTAGPADSGTNTAAAGALAALSSLWGLFILAVQAALWSQYLHGGFRAAFNVPAIIRRIRFSPGLTVVVGALGIGLSVMAVSGLILVVIGVLLTAPYTSLVGAYIFGEFSRMTDDAVDVPRLTARQHPVNT